MDIDDTKLDGEEQSPVDEAASVLANAEQEVGQAVGSDSMQENALEHTASHGSIEDNAEAVTDQAEHEVKQVVEGE